MNGNQASKNLLPTLVYPHEINPVIVAQKTAHQGGFVVSHHFDKLRQVNDYIEAHLAEDISLGELANHVKLSQSHFSHLFRQSTGKSPYKFLIQQRVERAKELLLKQDMAIADVAISVGFYDQSHLSRHMKKLLKLSPRQLRQQK